VALASLDWLLNSMNEHSLIRHEHREVVNDLEAWTLRRHGILDASGRPTGQEA
jgi:hypothetical protein